MFHRFRSTSLAVTVSLSCVSAGAETLPGRDAVAKPSVAESASPAAAAVPPSETGVPSNGSQTPAATVPPGETGTPSSESPTHPVAGATEATAASPVVAPLVSATPPDATSKQPTVAPTAEGGNASDSRPLLAPPMAPPRLRTPTLGWDVNLEGALGRYFPERKTIGFARGRGGVIYAADPWFYALGATYEWSNLANATFGIQAEALHIESGGWVQLGALLDTQVHPGAMASVGWSILGAEVQYRKFDPGDWGVALFGKLRIPVTFIAKAFE